MRESQYAISSIIVVVGVAAAIVNARNALRLNNSRRAFRVSVVIYIIYLCAMHLAYLLHIINIDRLIEWSAPSYLFGIMLWLGLGIIEH